jgi:hypothetical protein
MKHNHLFGYDTTSPPFAKMIAAYFSRYMPVFKLAVSRVKAENHEGPSPLAIGCLDLGQDLVPLRPAKRISGAGLCNIEPLDEQRRLPLGQNTP